MSRSGSRARRRVHWLGPVLLSPVLLAAFVGPWLAPYGPDEVDLLAELAPPSSAHWLGTAEGGVDVLTLLLLGARRSLSVALLSVGFAAGVGVPLGLLGGWRRGLPDQWVGALMDLVQAFPALVLWVLLLALWPRPGLLHVAAALAAAGWVPFARLARAEALRLSALPFVEAARALGASDRHILLRHLLPNALPPLLVHASAAMGGAVVAEATLAFLGLTADGTVSWGSLLEEGAAYLLRAPHVALAACGALTPTILGFHLTGDWLADRLSRSS